MKPDKKAMMSWMGSKKEYGSGMDKVKRKGAVTISKEKSTKILPSGAKRTTMTKTKVTPKGVTSKTKVRTKG